ncbi:MAG: hypothetical protein AAB225_02445, partial [Acidobacteriota bacterium]
MRTILAALAVTISAQLVEAQTIFNPSPIRVVGHASLTVKSGSPNLVEGRELWGPQSLALDLSASPPALYVADTGNNRVLGWRNAAQFSNGAYADIVIGQRDKVSTFTLGPGTTLRTGLTAPTGLAVDTQGNLYVVDTGNNRILRFPKPFTQPDEVKQPDMVIGQTSFDTRSANPGGVSASTVGVTTSRGTFRSTLLFDANGNLYFTDAGNHRVLRYPAAALAPGSPNGPAADLVLGQVDFTSTTALGLTTQNR